LKKAPLNSQSLKSLRKFADITGDFIRYWGFRRIHGQVWAVLYLTDLPMTGTELAKAIGVSKALISKATAELLEYKLIYSKAIDEKSIQYSAHEDVIQVIQHILETREKIIIHQAVEKCQDLIKTQENKTEKDFSPKRLQKVDEMVTTAAASIDMILATLKHHQANL
jgi:DNA-binding transcriptional regulator GbsR (MarR family)